MASKKGVEESRYSVTKAGARVPIMNSGSLIFLRKLVGVPCSNIDIICNQ